MDASSPAPMKATVTDFMSIMFHSANQSKTWHLQTKSYAQHVTLGEYYDGITAFTDDFIEKYMSDGPKVKAPQSIRLENLKDIAQITEHLDMIYKYLDKLRTELFKRTELVNMLDEAKALIEKTKYKLTLS